MDFGIAVCPTPESWKVAKRAEELGFSHAWFYDSQMLYTDVFVSMALAAEHTERIKLGTGVLIPTNRIAPVAASCFASLNRMAPGRIVFGAGTGFTGRNTMGLPAQRLDDLEEYCRVVLALLRGETPEWEAEGLRRKIRFLQPDDGFINLADAVPLHLSAFGPRGRQLTRDIADGWITFMGPLGAVLGQMKQMEAACAAEERHRDDLYTTVFTLGCVLAEGEAADSTRAMAQAGPAAAVSWHGMIENFSSLAPAQQDAAGAYRALYESYEPADARYLSLHQGHLLSVREDERAFVTADLIRAVTSTATAAELRDRLRALDAAGFDQVTVQLVNGHEDAIEDWARVFEMV